MGGAPGGGPVGGPPGAPGGGFEEGGEKDGFITSWGGAEEDKMDDMKEKKTTARVKKKATAAVYYVPGGVWRDQGGQAAGTLNFGICQKAALDIKVSYLYHFFTASAAFCCVHSDSDLVSIILQ